MKTNRYFEDKTVLSFEVFPPKATTPIDTIYQTLEGLKKLSPDFISVTYGAGGSENSNATIQIARTIKERYHTESVAHLPCIGQSKESLRHQLSQLQEAGIENILALRGDRRPGLAEGDFRYATELISFIKEVGDFHVLAACYPEVHQEADGAINDIRHLKAKVDAGAGQLISQLFFDNEAFYRFRERTELAGIHVPIEAGIMPVVNRKQIERIVSLCHASLPKKFLTIMEKYESSPEAMRDAGIAYANDQIIDLLANGVDGIHLYTMNQPYIATKIYEAIHRLLPFK
ncbi:MAG: methylenetetrahydrofolate reductase [NAD(P)H] [Eubacteriales bacterium]|nr:methylenetetrahydrofolate reductase [NAD(P)H] [Eubacteriales bacterium]